VLSADAVIAAITPGGWLEKHLPDFLKTEYFALELWQWLGLPLAIVLALVLSRLLEWLLMRGAHKLAKATTASWDDELVAALEGPLRWSLVALLVHAFAQVLLLEGQPRRLADLAVNSLLISAVARLALRSLRVATQAGSSRSTDPSARTHFAVTHRLLEVGIIVVAAAVFLMQFEVVRTVGVSLLASAGVVSVVIGLAAQKSIGQLLAGLQLSITQPIRLGDLVVVDGQFGTVEEIRLTFVVVRTWDLRRMVVPISFFLDKTFENWSRATTELLGAVVLKVDYSADVGALREELSAVLARPDVQALWDGRTREVSVTDADDKTMSVRFLVGAKLPSQAFDLRCLVRESMLACLARHPTWLPRARAESVVVPAPQ